MIKVSLLFTLKDCDSEMAYHSFRVNQYFDKTFIKNYLLLYNILYFIEY